MTSIADSVSGRFHICKTALNQCPEIKVTCSGPACRYHRENSKNFNFNQLTPKGLCMHAFHSVYPSCLKILYTGRGNNIEGSLVCPNPEISVEFKVFGIRHANLWRLALHHLKYLARLMGIPCDYLMKRIFIKVTGIKGICPKGHCVGRVFEFNLGNKPEICPASFESIYPVVHASSLKNQLRPDADEDNEYICIQCPSHSVDIRYYVPFK